MLIEDKNIYFVYKSDHPKRLMFIVKVDESISREEVAEKLTSYENRKMESWKIAFEICDGWGDFLYDDDEKRLSEAAKENLGWDYFSYDVTVPSFLKALEEIKKSDVTTEWDEELIHDLEELKEIYEEEQNGGGFDYSGIEIIHVKEEDEIEIQIEDGL